MDPITQNINQNIDEYLEGLVNECLQSPGIINLTPEQKQAIAGQIQNHFTQVVMEVLVDKMDESQFSQIENLEPGSQEMVDKIQVLAAQVPGLTDAMEAKLRQDVEYIKQYSKLPENPA